MNSQKDRKLWGSAALDATSKLDYLFAAILK